MAEPRFQLRSVRRRREPAGGPAPLLVTDTRATGRDDLIVWRLLGSNNRELGRSAIQFATEQSAEGAIDQLKVRLAGRNPVTPSLHSALGLGHEWWWTLGGDGQQLATASRTFSRNIECRRNFEQFVGNAVRAALAHTSDARSRLTPSALGKGVS